MARRESACSFKKPKRADKVALYIGAGVLNGVTHARLCGEVEDHFGALFREKGHKEPGVLDLAKDMMEVRVGLKDREPRLF